MATVEKTVELIFQGIDQTSDTLLGIKTNLGGLNDIVQQVAAPLAAVGEGVLKTDAALAVFAATLAGTAVKAAGDFGTSFNEISTLTNASAGDLEKFRQQILDYAKTSGASLDEITKAVYAAMSAGVDYSKALDVVKQTEALAIATRNDLGVTTTLVAGVMNAYGASASDASKYTDALMVAVQGGQLRLSDLNTTLARVTNTAAAAGIPFGDLMAAIAALTAKGMPAEQAVSGLKEAIANVIKPSADAQKTAEALGIQFDSNALKSMGLAGFLDMLKTATGGNVDQMAKFFGSVEALNAVMAICNDTSGGFKKQLDAQAAAAGATAAAHQKMADDFKVINNQIVNNLRITLIDLGVPLLKQYGDAAKGLEAVFQGLSLGIKADAFKPVYDALGQFASDVADYLQKVAKALPAALQQLDFSGLIASFGGLGAALSDAFKGIDLTTPEGLAKAMQAAVNTLSTLVDVTSGIVIGLTPAFRMLGEMITQFNAMSTQDKIDFGDKVLASAMLVKDAGTIIGTVLLAIGDNADGIKKAVTLAFDGIPIVLESFKAGLLLVKLGWEEFLLAITSGMAKIAWGDSGKQWAADAAVMQGAVDQTKASLADLQTNFERHAGKISSAFDEPKAAVKGLEDQAKTSAGNLSGLDWSFEGLVKAAQQADALGGGLAKAGAAAQAAEPPLFDFKTAATQGGDAVDKMVLGSTMLTQSFSGMPIPIAEATRNIEQSKKTTGSLGDTLGDTASKVRAFIQFQKDQSDGTINLTGALDLLESGLGKAGGALAKTSVAMQSAAQDSESFRIKMAQIAADLSAKNYKLDVDLQVAKIQAETKQIEDAFKSIDAAIGNTGSMITQLFGQMGSAMASHNSLLAMQIQQQIDKEEQRRQASFDLQQKLVQAQIDTLNLRNQLMQQGGGLIKIDSTGLSPALQLVMWEILEKIQLQVNASATDFLLGIN